MQKVKSPVPPRWGQGVAGGIRGEGPSGGDGGWRQGGKKGQAGRKVKGWKNSRQAAVARQFHRCHVRTVSKLPSTSPARPRRVALFVTCLVDLFRPSIGFAAVKLLEDAGCTVEVPSLQVCCGQPAYNTGDRATTRAIAAQVIEAFEGFDAVVAPSGSCGGMLSHHYPGLFDDDPAMKARAENLAGRSYELMSFLVDVLGVKQGRRALRRRRHLSRFLLGPARARREAAAPRAARLGAGPEAQRDEDAGSLLRFRRHLLREVSRDLECHGGREVGRHRGHRRRHAAGRRSRLPDEHGGQAAAAKAAPSRCAMSPRCWPGWATCPRLANRSAR